MVYSHFLMNLILVINYLNNQLKQKKDTKNYNFCSFGGGKKKGFPFKGTYCLYRSDGLVYKKHL